MYLCSTGVVKLLDVTPLICWPVALTVTPVQQASNPAITDDKFVPEKVELYGKTTLIVLLQSIFQGMSS